MESSLFTEAIDAVSEAVLLLDPVGRLKYANLTARTLLNLQADVLTATNVSEICDPEYRDELASALTKVTTTSPTVMSVDPIFGIATDQRTSLEFTSIQRGDAVLLVRRASMPHGRGHPALTETAALSLPSINWRSMVRVISWGR